MPTGSIWIAAALAEQAAPLAGVRVNGMCGWFRVGAFSLQPTEPAKAKDPFDNWSDPTAGNTAAQPENSAADNDFSHVSKPEFNVFNDDTASSDDSDDDNLSTPPFFKNRRK